MFLFPWCFLLGISLVLGYLLADCTGFLRVCTVRKIIDIFEVFLGKFENTNEKKTGNHTKIVRTSAAVVAIFTAPR